MKKVNKELQEAMYQLLEKWLSSGMTLKAYGEQEGISYYKLKYWKSKYKEEDKEQSANFKETMREFVPIKLAKENRCPVFPNLEIIYPNGVKVNCSSEFQSEHLKMLIQLY